MVTPQVAFVASPVMRVNVRATILSEGDGVVTNDFTIAFRQQRGQVLPPLPSPPLPPVHMPVVLPLHSPCPVLCNNHLSPTHFHEKKCCNSGPP